MACPAELQESSKGPETTLGLICTSQLEEGTRSIRQRQSPQGLRHSHGTSLQCACLRGAGTVSAAVNESEELLGPALSTFTASPLTTPYLVTRPSLSSCTRSHPVAYYTQLCHGSP